MNENLVCECGNPKMWFFWDFCRCPKCLNEYKIIAYVNPLNPADVELEYVMRRFNKEENKYPEKWEKSLKTYKK